MTTSVPQPVFGDKGFVPPTEAEILDARSADINSAFGNKLNMSPATPQGQLATSDTAIIGFINDMFAYFCNMVDPAFSSGRMQDAIARIYFIERIPSKPTTLQIACVGANGLTIPVGAKIVDGAGNLYSCTAAGTIGGSGVITLPFDCDLPGPTAIPASDGVAIYDSIGGWDTVSCAGGVVGRNVERRDEFEARRSLSVAKNAMGHLAAIRGAVLAVNDVLDAFVTENPGTTVLTVKGFSIAPNSIYVCVAGGLAADVARAIWTKKAPGCGYNGDTTATVQDESSGYTPPYPSYQVSFQTAKQVPVVFDVEMVDSPAVPSDAQDQVAAAIVGAMNGEDGGERATIAHDILASRFYCAIAALGGWAKVRSIKIGAETSAPARFTGSMSGSTLTVTAVAAGALAVGQTIKDSAGNVLAGTFIASLGTGSGGIGTYNISKAQSVSSAAMCGIVADQDDVTINLDQIATAFADDVRLALS